MWVAFTQLIDSFLVAYHTTHQGYQKVASFCFGVFEQGKLVMCLFLWCFTHATRIENHEIGLVHTRLFPSQFLKDCLDALRIRLIHLASNRPNMIFPVCNFGRRGHHIASRALLAYTD